MPIIVALEDPTPFEGKYVPQGTKIRMLPDYAEARVKTGRWAYSDATQTDGEKQVAEYLGVQKEKEPIKVEVEVKEAPKTASKKKVKPAQPKV